MKGIKQQSNGSWRVFVGVDGERKWKRLPASYSRAAVVAWREKERTRLRFGVDAAPDDAPRFSQDAKDYLHKVRSMPSAKDRIRHIERWVKAFGPRIRSSITTQEIDAVLEDWIAEGMSGAYANRHRTALMHLWTKLDGKGERNPVKGTDKRPEGQDAPVRVQPYDAWEEIHQAIGRSHTRFRTSRHPGDLTRARFGVFMWTGWPHVVLKRLDLDTDVDWRNLRAYVRQRRKGKGVVGRWIKILPQAKDALKEYARCLAKHAKQARQKSDDLRVFSNSGMHGSVMTAIEHCNAKRKEKGLDPLPKMRPYDVRHSFGTLMALIVKDERALQDLLIHASPKMVRHYTELATEPRTAAAVSSLAKAIESGRAFRSLKLAVGNFGNFEAPNGPDQPRNAKALKLAKGSKIRGK